MKVLETHDGAARILSISYLEPPSPRDSVVTVAVNRPGDDHFFIGLDSLAGKRRIVLSLADFLAIQAAVSQFLLPGG